MAHHQDEGTALSDGMVRAIELLFAVEVEAKAFGEELENGLHLLRSSPADETLLADVVELVGDLFAGSDFGERQGEPDESLVLTGQMLQLCGDAERGCNFVGRFLGFVRTSG